MPGDVNAVINELFDRGPGQHRLNRPRSMTRLDEGVVALDYGDQDHAFQVTVERVLRRRWTPRQPLSIGRVEGIEAQLVGVTVDVSVHVHLTAAPSDERDRLSRAHHDAFEQWAATAQQTQADPPEDPARRLMQIAVTVTDALGTAYLMRYGQSGGTGTEWEATQSFGPRPPAAVHELRLTLQAPNQPVVSVPIRLQGT